MKLTILAGAAVGYVLGAKAGHERYEAIVRASHRFKASQTVQSTAGVLQAQLDELSTRARGALRAKLRDSVGLGPAHGVNGHDRTDGHSRSARLRA